MGRRGRPPLRVGAAYGAVLTRLGDVHSPVVNLASRLTSLARPGTVLVDRELAERLRDVPGYKVRSLRRVSVAGTTTSSRGWCAFETAPPPATSATRSTRTTTSNADRRPSADDD